MQTSLPEITLKGHLTEGRKSIGDGQAVIGINGAATLAGLHGTATLYITRTSHPLPVMLEMRQTGGAQAGAVVTITLSHFGERVAVPVPAKRIPIGQI